MESVIPIIEGEVKDAKCVSGGIPFTNLAHLTDGTLVPGNPDRYYGARPEQLNRKVRTELSGYIIPSTQNDLPAAPNFFVAGKGPDGSIAVAGRQASYDGALGARGIQSLRSYGQGEPAYDNNAYTITTLYHGGTLKMYTSHPAQPSSSGSRPEYFVTQLGAFAMTNNTETFRDGAKAFRNARDWAKEQRDEAIRQANEKANDIPSTTPTCSTSAASFTTEVSTFVAAASLVTFESLSTQIEASNTSKTPHQDSDTSTDELARDVKPPAKRSKSGQSRYRKRNTGASRDRRSNTTAETVVIGK